MSVRVLCCLIGIACVETGSRLTISLLCVLFAHHTPKPPERYNFHGKQSQTTNPVQTANSHAHIPCVCATVHAVWHGPAY